MKKSRLNLVVYRDKDGNVVGHDWLTIEQQRVMVPPNQKLQKEELFGKGATE